MMKLKSGGGWALAANDKKSSACRHCGDPLLLGDASGLTLMRQAVRRRGI